MSVRKYYTFEYAMILKMKSKCLQSCSPQFLPFCLFNVKLASNFHEWICISQTTVNEPLQVCAGYSGLEDIKLSCQI